MNESMTNLAVSPHVPPWFAFWANPIAQRCRRARLRGRHIAVYGLLGLAVIGFVFLVAYLLPVYQFDRPHAFAARSAIIPMLVIQGIALMGMGTMALATGIARERDRDLLDYQRMTPMGPTAKILGYLFGLPAREYFLFGITVPFVLYAVWVGELPLLKVCKYYVVFFSAVWCYHLTGLCAGMVSRKPWQSAVISVGLVVVLYLVLPQLSYVGLWVFEYLTVYPTFFTLLAEELNDGDRVLVSGRLIQMYEDVRFFNAAVDPLWFSLALQGGLILTLFTVVRRKWIDAGRHAFSKPFGLGFVLAVHVLVVGTLWSALRDGSILTRIGRAMGDLPAQATMGWLLGLYVVVSASAVLLTTFLITPGQHGARRGYRRARKNGRASVPMAWDAAPALRWVFGLVALSVVGYAVLVALARQNPDLFRGPLEWGWVGSPILILALMALLFHGLAERCKPRVLLLAAFGLWVFPIMVGVIAAIVLREELAVLYLGAPSPLIAGVLSLVGLTYHTGLPSPTWDDGFERDVLSHVPTVITLFVGVAAVVTLFVQVNRVRWMARWRAEEAERLPDAGV